MIAAAERSGTRLLVTADHGNCEMMIDPETGGPHTAHTTNPVPLVVVDADSTRRCAPAARCATSARRSCACWASSSRTR